jgi:hypothetical protein
LRLLAKPLEERRDVAVEQDEHLPNAQLGDVGLR